MSNYAANSSAADIDLQKLGEYRDIFERHFKVTRSSIAPSLDYESIREELEELTSRREDYSRDLQLLGQALAERKEHLENQFNTVMSLSRKDIETFLPHYMSSDDASTVGAAVQGWEDVEGALED